MRIWFGLILKIMVRTKSYILPELCYLTKPIGKCAKLQFFSRYIPSCSASFPRLNEQCAPALMLKAALYGATTGFCFAIHASSSPSPDGTQF